MITTRRTLLSSLLATGVVRSQEPPANDRDARAIKEAVDGWWTRSMKTREQRIAWWREARFGCFIHWGVYSGPGGEWKGEPFRGYAEHLMRIKKIPLAEYRREVVARFNPVKFDANEWVRIIKSAGMKYVVITAKHHDGFAIYPSKVSKYNIADATPFKRDPMRELSDACRRAGLRFGFYYSHAFDWEDPNAPGNDWDYDNPGGDKLLHGGLTWYDQHPELLAKARKYVDQKAIPQVVELAKMYQPDLMWFDTPHKLPVSEQLRILKALREVAPDVVVDGRCARAGGQQFGDYQNTGDRAAEFPPTEGDWESMPTTNESYGYHRHDNTHKPSEYFIQLIAKAAARGGNILMNIGPMGDGRIDPKDVRIFAGVGKWLSVNGASIYGTERTPLPVQCWGESTRKGNTLYLHVFDWPADGKLVVGGVDAVLTVAKQAPDPTDSVVVLKMPAGVKINPVRLLGRKNVLRVFDGERHGSKLRFGDGKAPTAYVYEWRDPREWMGWRVRLEESAEFEVSIRYTAPEGCKGQYAVSIGDQTLRGVVDPAAKVANLGQIKLKPGQYEVAVRPVLIEGGELMRLYSVSLITPAAFAPAARPQASGSPTGVVRAAPKIRLPGH